MSNDKLIYRSNHDIIKRSDSKGLRLSGVKNHPLLIIDQYGRVFENNKKMECVGTGYATH